MKNNSALFYTCSLIEFIGRRQKLRRSEPVSYTHLDVYKRQIEDRTLQEVVQVLLQELDSIYFVFDIKKDGQHVFPIHNMVAKVVGEPDFVDIKKTLGIYHIHILQLAVRLFTNSDDKQKILRTLVEQCNLRFIEYLSESGYIIDLSLIHIFWLWLRERYEVFSGKGVPGRGGRWL